MNLILLSGHDAQTLAAGTPQAEHLLRVLKIKPGGTFWCGVKNGPRGIAEVQNISSSGEIIFSVTWESEVLAVLPPVHLLVGLSRPQTMKKIFSIAGEIGCRSISVFVSERGDPSYRQSSLWRSGDREISSILEKSAEQACSTLIPTVSMHENLASACAKAVGARIALDVYANESLATENITAKEVSVAVGSERGWTDAEREVLRGNRFAFAHIGERVLRVENAVAAALVVAQEKLRCWERHKTI